MRAQAYLTPENRAETIEGWLRKIARQTPPRPHLILDPDRAALVIIDVQRIFCEPDGKLFLPAWSAVAGPLREFARAWVSAGRPLAATRHAHPFRDPADPMMVFYGEVIVRDDPQSALVEGWPADPDCPVFTKKTYDAFVDTDLAAWLKATGRTQVVFAGVRTHLCVETTVRSAFVRGFLPFVLADGCADSTGSLHENALVAMASGCAVVTTIEEVSRTCR